MNGDAGCGIQTWWNMELECKPDFDTAMKRIYAWYEGEILDRAPVRFTAHNAFVNEKVSGLKWGSLKDKWFDAEFQVGCFYQSIQCKQFLAETFPVFWPNLGPNVFAAFYGGNLKFTEVTSWAEPLIGEWSVLSKLKLDMGNEYFIKIEELTNCALEM